MHFGWSHCLIGVSLISWCPNGPSGEKIEKRNMRWIPRNSVFAGKLSITQPIDKRTRLPFNQGNQNKVFCIFPVFSSPSYEAFRFPPLMWRCFHPMAPIFFFVVVVQFSRSFRLVFFCYSSILVSSPLLWRLVVVLRISQADLKAVRYEWPCMTFEF